MDELVKLAEALNKARDEHATLEDQKYANPARAIGEQIVLDVQIMRAWDRLMQARGAYDAALKAIQMEAAE